MYGAVIDTCGVRVGLALGLGSGLGLVIGPGRVEASQTRLDGLGLGLKLGFRVSGWG